MEYIPRTSAAELMCNADDPEIILRELARELRQTSWYPADGTSHLMDDALDLMCYAHENQTRGSDRPYTAHPARCALFVVRLDVPGNPELAIASSLHDTVEDQPKRVIQYILSHYPEKLSSQLHERISRLGQSANDKGTHKTECMVTALQAIEEVFGEKTAFYVEWLTYVHSSDDLATDEKQLQRMQYLRDMTDHFPEIALAKLADFVDNASRLDHHEAMLDPDQYPPGTKEYNHLANKLHPKYSEQLALWRGFIQAQMAQGASIPADKLLAALDKVEKSLERVDAFLRWQPSSDDMLMSATYFVAA